MLPGLGVYATFVSSRGSFDPKNSRYQIGFRSLFSAVVHSDLLAWLMSATFRSFSLADECHTQIFLAWLSSATLRFISLAKQ